MQSHHLSLSRLQVSPSQRRCVSRCVSLLGLPTARCCALGGQKQHRLTVSQPCLYDSKVEVSARPCFLWNARRRTLPRFFQLLAALGTAQLAAPWLQSLPLSSHGRPSHRPTVKVRSLQCLPSVHVSVSSRGVLLFLRACVRISLFL